MRMYFLMLPTADLNLSAAALPNSITFHRQERIIKDENQQIPSLKRTKGDTILIGCQIEKSHTKCMTATLCIVVNYVEGKHHIHTYTLLTNTNAGILLLVPIQHS